LRGSTTAQPLYLLLTYLHRRHFIELAPGLLRELSSRQCSVGEPSLRILHALIDRYVVNGLLPGPVLSSRNLSILWDTLLSPRPPWRNLLLIPWMLCPSWAGLKAQLSRLRFHSGLKE
jgi:hypothetical protein